MQNKLLEKSNRIYDNVKYLGNADNSYYALIGIVADTSSSCSIHIQTKIIAAGAFGGCENLTNVKMGNSVTMIGKGAFANCNSLTKVVFEDTSTWYRTSNYEDWQNKVNGTQVDVSDAATAAALLKDNYDYYWYKL